MGMTWLIWLRRSCIGLITRRIGTRNRSFGDLPFDSHTKLSSVPFPHNHLSHLISSLLFSCSILPLPRNTKSSHFFLSIHPMITRLTLYSTHQVQHTLCTAYSVYCIIQNIDCLPLPASLSSSGRPWCIQFFTFPQLRVYPWIESKLSLRLPREHPPSDWMPLCTALISLDYNDHVHLETCLIIASKCISILTQLRSPSLFDHRHATSSRNLLDHRIWMHLYTRLIIASNVSQNSLD
jgi:hypothetical protein